MTEDFLLNVSLLPFRLFLPVGLLLHSLKYFPVIFTLIVELQVNHFEVSV